MVDEDLTERPRIAELLLEHGDRDVFGVDLGLLLKQLAEHGHVGWQAR